MLLLFTSCLHVYCLSYINKYIIILLTFMLFDLFITNQTKIKSQGMRTILQGVLIKINIWTLVIFIIKNGSYVKMGNPTFYSNTAFSYLIWIIYDNSSEKNLKRVSNSNVIMLHDYIVKKKLRVHIFHNYVYYVNKV